MSEDPPCTWPLQGCHAPVVTCSFPCTAAPWQGGSSSPLQNTVCDSFPWCPLLILPCRCFVSTSANICCIRGSANTTYPRTQHIKLSFIYFKAQRGNPAEKSGAPWQLWGSISISSLLCFTVLFVLRVKAQPCKEIRPGLFSFWPLALAMDPALD